MAGFTISGSFLSGSLPQNDFKPILSRYNPNYLSNEYDVIPQWLQLILIPFLYVDNLNFRDDKYLALYNYI